MGSWIAEVLHALAQQPDGNAAVEARVRQAVAALCARFPIYPEPDLSRDGRA